MAKGRNAAKTFTATRGARFAESRRRSEDQKDAERAAGTRRTMVMVDVDDVRDDDEIVTAARGFVAVADAERDEWVVSNGQTMVQRFVKAGA